MIKDRKTKSFIYSRRMMFIKLLVLAVSSALIFSGCSSIKGDFFGMEFGGGQEVESENPFEDLEDPVYTVTEVPEEEEVVESSQEQAPAEASLEALPEERDLEEMRYFYSEAMRYFDEEAYVIAEFYLLKIKDSYLILQDHIFYYLAKSMLMQKKYDQSLEYYTKVLQNFPDSIWKEKSSLETADLFFLKEDYAGAEIKYNDFLNLYPGSDYLPYCLYQLAVCKEKMAQPADAFTNYKRIWLEYPASEYADMAYLDIERLEEEGTIASFSPSQEDLYSRSESLFYTYRYQEASEQLLALINGYPRNSFTSETFAKTCFRLGMSYYNMSDYNTALDWLLLCYEEEPYSSIAHAALFFSGRTYTNLDNDTKAISYYEKLISEYPSSSYGDDALYRMGRIYSINNNADKAINSFDRVFREYPSGDKTDEALWELGWIQYKSGDWNGAKKSFSNMASLFDGTVLQEKALYWQAKSLIRLGETEDAAGLCRQITGLRNYSYYTFAAQKLAESIGNPVIISGINMDLSPGNPAAERLLPGIFEDLDRDIANIDGRVDHITKALELIRMDFYNSASLEIGAGEDILEEDPERTLEIATLYHDAEDYSKCISLIFNNLSKIRDDLSEDYLAYAYYLYYPYGFRDIIDKYSAQYGVDPLFVLAVIRQESNFKADAGSYAGARGLMQIMPATGSNIARQIGLNSYEEEMLYDPEVNIQMGIYYLDQQLGNFDRNLVYCLGAYNGGPGSMNSWISRFGGISEDEFIENITFIETKEYIKKVLGNYYFYQALYP